MLRIRLTGSNKWWRRSTLNHSRSTTTEGDMGVNYEDDFIHQAVKEGARLLIPFCPDCPMRTLCRRSEMTQRGVYFLANDGILDMAIAFLNSFRTYNPSTALCLIPYADDVEQFTSLHQQYNFTVWSDVDKLRWCDDISWSFHGCVVGQYRKLAMWEGPFDRFVYIDCDTVVLHNIDFASGISTGATFSLRTRTCPKPAPGCGKTLCMPPAR